MDNEAKVYVVVTKTHEGDEGNFDTNDVLGVFASRALAERDTAYRDDAKIVEWTVTTE